MNKKITHSTRFIMRFVNIALFAYIWCVYYSGFIFSKHLLQGRIISVVIYSLLYIFLSRLYKVFRIASKPSGDLILSHLIAFGLPDLIFYIECCLIAKRYVSIVPGSIIVCLQLFMTAGCIRIAKRCLRKYTSPEKTIVVYGENIHEQALDLFLRRLLAVEESIFDIQTVIRNPEAKNADLSGYNAVLLYDIPVSDRGIYIKKCYELGIPFYYTPRICDLILDGCSPRAYLDTPLFKYDRSYPNSTYLIVKRALDIFFSAAFLIIFSPVMLFTAAAIKIEDGGPIFFRQRRHTTYGKEFDIIKFRSMIPDADKHGVSPTASRDPRITKTGNIIRKFRIDELPQLFNILRGDMSFVGPRPERIEHTDLYSAELPEFKYRLKVKGGLTGYAQVYGKYNTSPYDKLRLDLFYIEHQSLWNDFRLVLLTIRTVFQKESTEGFSEEKLSYIKRRSAAEKKNIIAEERFFS